MNHLSMIKDIRPGSLDSNPNALTVFGDTLYFAASGSDEQGNPVGTELWKYDGADVVFVDINPGTASSSPSEFVVFDGWLYFRAVGENISGDPIGEELWRYNGANLEFVDIYPGATSSVPHDFAVFDGALYFNATGQDAEGNPTGEELWKYNGTDLELVDINPGTASSSSPADFTVFNGALYFRATGPDSDRFTDAEFGWSVASVGSNFLVGVPNRFPASGQSVGAAFLFDGVTGDLLQSFYCPDGSSSGDNFGVSVASVGGNVLVGAPRVDKFGDAAGAAYLFDGTTGDLLHSFYSPEPAAWDEFGTSVAIIGDKILVSALYADGGAGAAYLFGWTGTTYEWVHSFYNPDATPNGNFGEAVAGVGENILIGVPNRWSAARGAAYLFDGTSPTYDLLQSFYGPDSAANDEDWFGLSVAAIGENMLVGRTDG